MRVTSLKKEPDLVAYWQFNDPDEYVLPLKGCTIGRLAFLDRAGAFAASLVSACIRGHALIELLGSGLLDGCSSSVLSIKWWPG